MGDNNLVATIIQTVAIYALPVLFAITLHEAAHGYVARHFGDLTAHAQGRISLNPLRHIDPVGTILVPLVILVLSTKLVGGGLLFGWAKPVPVNYSALRNPRKHMALVAAAGPLANLLMALIWVALLKLSTLMAATTLSEPLALMSQAGILVNLIFMFLNLLPILPLDGGRIVATLLPRRAAWQYSRLEPWGVPLLILLLLTNVLSFVLEPLVGASDALIRALVF
ncbi:MAG TPA: site-2 protease family protein [Burkholderiales bacterium]|nr:site-2 protease family protein [Burkholderiales bacterium]